MINILRRRARIFWEVQIQISILRCNKSVIGLIDKFRIISLISLDIFDGCHVYGKCNEVCEKVDNG